MLNYLIIITFILSVAAAASGILIASNLRALYKLEVFSTLIYYQTFYYTFGFYAFWGQIFFTTYLSTYVEEELIVRITNILLLIGSPFVMFSWLMLLKFTGELSGRIYRGFFVFWFLALNVTFTVVPGYLIYKFFNINSFTIIKSFYMALSLIYAITGASFLLTARKQKAIISTSNHKVIAAGIISAVAIHSLLLVFYHADRNMALVFIFVFFITGTFIPVYIKYRSDVTGLTDYKESRYTIDALCEKFDISPREKEIVREICNGLSNQQIADKLFISLQTVKDHTSRIYFKINCSSRTQLITMIREQG